MSGKSGMTSALPRDIPPGAQPGADLLDLLDGRSGPARDIRAKVRAICSDLGGPDVLSHAQRSLVTRAANLEGIVTAREARLLTGELKDDDDFLKGYRQAVALLCQLYKTLGLKRRAKEIPTLNDHLRVTYGEEA